jgi:hypothetical protein
LNDKRKKEMFVKRTRSCAAAVAPQLFGLKINKLMDVGYSSSVTFQQHNTHKLSRASGPDRGLPISPPKKHEAH